MSDERAQITKASELADDAMAYIGTYGMTLTCARRAKSWRYTIRTASGDKFKAEDPVWQIALTKVVEMCRKSLAS